LVVLLEVVDDFLLGNRVGMREDVAYVVDGIVYPVGLDTVVGFNTLASGTVK